MKTQKTCSRCQSPIYASYKTHYFCAKHLKEFLEEEKKKIKMRGKLKE